jgi:hypothetical protein
MEIKIIGNEIRLDGKVLNDLDKEVIRFVKILGVKYVIISGYIAILFGRPRTTEDVDIFVEIDDFRTFDAFYKRLVSDGYYCMSNGNSKELYGQFREGLPLRIAKNDIVFPNFEVKKPVSDSAKIAIEERKIIRFGSTSLYISPIDLQIAYKLYLGSDKDYEDARFLYLNLGSHLDRKGLKEFIAELNIKDSVVKKVLGNLNEKN